MHENNNKRKIAFKRIIIAFHSFELVVYIYYGLLVARNGDYIYELST